MTTTADYTEKIPNNVDLHEDRRLQRALESWQPNFLSWWESMGPTLPDRRRLPAHRDERRPRGLGALRARRDARLPVGHLPGRARPGPGDRASASTRASPPGSRCPANTAPTCRRLIVIQGDTEPASVEQQRNLGATAPSLYDLRNLFQVNVEEGRHLWAMVYLLHAYFGREGREEAEELLHRNSGSEDSAADPRRVQRGDPGLAVVLHVHLLHRPGRQVPARHAEGDRPSTRCPGPVSSCSRKRRTTCSSALPASTG